MNANKITLEAVLARDCQYVAPLFQRPYVWNEDQNWSPLWEAIKESFHRRFDEKPRSYFLGALVFDQVANQTGAIPKREIIDGQQRLITLQLLMEAARAEAETRGLTYCSGQLSRMTRNETEEKTDEVYKVWPTNINREEFRHVMAGSEVQGLLSQAKDYFAIKVADLLGTQEEDARERAKVLVACLKNDLVFVAIDLENDDDGQLIFETLNSLGTPLLPSDLVKNLLFRKAVEEGLETDRLYIDYWKPFEDDAKYWRGTTSSGRRNRPRLDLFLQSYLVLKLGKEPSAAHLFREYRDAFKGGKFGSTEEAMSDLSELARIFRSFDEAKTGSQAADLRDVLEVLDLTSAYPIVLGAFKFVQCQTETNDILVLTESYLMRRFLCGLTPKNYNKVIADWVGVLNRNGWSVENFAGELNRSNSNSTIWPEDSHLHDRLVDGQVYGILRGVGIAYALSRVERSRRGSFAEEPWNSRTPLSLEHLMPKSWELHWPLADSAGRDFREECVNKMGNLTVLTQKMNSGVSNKGWDEKRAALKRETVLRINLDLVEHEVWNEDLIQERCKHLAEEFCKIWKRKG